MSAIMCKYITCALYHGSVERYVFKKGFGLTRFDLIAGEEILDVGFVE